jgi:hypothetical protein
VSASHCSPAAATSRKVWHTLTAASAPQPYASWHVGSCCAAALVSLSAQYKHLTCWHYLAGARTMSVPSSTPPATSVTTYPSGTRWKHSPAAATHKRSTNPSCSSTWRLGSHMEVHLAVAAVGSATARRTPTVLRASNACRQWHSLSIRPAGCQACYEPHS